MVCDFRISISLSKLLVIETMPISSIPANTPVFLLVSPDCSLISNAECMRYTGVWYRSQMVVMVKHKAIQMAAQGQYTQYFRRLVCKLFVSLEGFLKVVPFISGLFEDID